MRVPVWGGRMRRRTLLSMFVVLLLVGVYTAYALSQPKLPEVKGCVSPFKAVKPLERRAENWSSAHVFVKVLASKDIRSLVKPWEIDYKNVKVVKHTVEYEEEKIEILAIGIPLKDGKHVIGYYEFSKPVQGVKTRAYLLEFSVSENEKYLTTQTITTNGEVTPLSSCKHECTSDTDCGYFANCVIYCCDHDWWCMWYCCGPCAASCGVCATGNALACGICLSCVVSWCPYCAQDCCEEEGSYCEYLDPGP